MDYAELEHAIRAACRVSGDTEVYVFGSQAILGSFPEAPASLLRSAEADIQPKNRPEATVLVDGALGEDSDFHRLHGFWVHGVEMAVAALPGGWESRTVPVSHPVGTRGGTGLCVEPHDLAASKLVAGRDKDLEFADALLREGLIDSAVLGRRLDAIPPGHEDAVRRARAFLASRLP